MAAGAAAAEPLPEPPPAAEPLPLREHRGRVLVWGAEAARELRERYRMSGRLVGAPGRGGRGGGARLPLQLLPEEGRLLAESGVARFLAPVPLAADEAPPPESGPTAPPPADPSPHDQRFRVYRDLWGRGLHVTGGGKFGGDFLVYPGPPERFHAAAVALVPPPGAELPVGALVGAARLGTHVRKTLLLCSAPPGAGPAYTSVTWRSDL